MIESGETSVILYHHHDHRAGRRLTGVAGALSEPHRQTGQASAGRAWRRRRSGACRFGVDHDRSSGARGDAEGDRCRCSSGAVGLDREVRMIPSNSAWKAVPLPPGPCSRASCDTQPRSSPQTGRVVDRLGTGVKRWSDLATPRRKARPPFRLAALAHGPPFQRRPAGRWSIFDRNTRTTPARGQVRATGSWRRGDLLSAGEEQRERSDEHEWRENEAHDSSLCRLVADHAEAVTG